jgi:hypothetical protein
MSLWNGNVIYIIYDLYVEHKVVTSWPILQVLHAECRA